MTVNMISTGVMVRLGKVYQNYMVHVQPTNEKLIARSCGMISQITGVDTGRARAVLNETNMDVPQAIVMLLAGCNSAQAQTLLQQANGRVRDALKLAEAQISQEAAI